MSRDGKTIARFVAYVDANTVRERLDSVVPGEWSIELTQLTGAADADGVAVAAFKGRLIVRGVVREDVGTGKDLKSASSDCYKRCAARFGIAHHLHKMFVFVALESDQKYAKPVEDPQDAWDRKNRGSAKPPVPAASPVRAAAAPTPRPASIPQIDPLKPRGAPAPSRPPEPPPLDDGDLPF